MRSSFFHLVKVSPSPKTGRVSRSRFLLSHWLFPSTTLPSPKVLFPRLHPPLEGNMTAHLMGCFFWCLVFFFFFWVVFFFFLGWGFFFFFFFFWLLFCGGCWVCFFGVLCVFFFVLFLFLLCFCFCVWCFLLGWGFCAIGAFPLTPRHRFILNSDPNFYAFPFVGGLSLLFAFHRYPSFFAGKRALPHLMLLFFPPFFPFNLSRVSSVGTPVSL